MFLVAPDNRHSDMPRRVNILTPIGSPFAVFEPFASMPMAIPDSTFTLGGGCSGFVLGLNCSPNARVEDRVEAER